MLVVQPSADQRLLLDGVSWEEYTHSCACFAVDT